MTYFNSQVAKWVALTLGAGLIISCSENNKPQVTGPNNSTFYVDALTAKFTTVGEPNAQGKHSKKLLSLEACLKDNAQTNSVTNLPFEISAGEVAAIKKSDYRGCLLWQELIEYDPDSEVKNVFMTRVVGAKESHSGSEKVVFSVNPYKDQFEFNRQGSMGGAVNVGPVSYKLRDLTTASNTNFDYDIYVKINEDVNSLLSPIRRQAEVTELRLKYRNIDFSNLGIDSNLNLTFPYAYTTSLAMDLIRQDLGNIASEKIKRGNFQFHLVFLREMSVVQDPKPSDVIAAVRFNGRPRGDAGVIEVPLIVNFSNIAALSNRMSVLLTITSLDVPALFADQTYEGSVNSVATNQDLGIGLVQNQNSARDLFTAYEAVKVQRPVKSLTLEEVLKEEGFEALKNAEIAVSKNVGWFKKLESETVNLSLFLENLRDNTVVSAKEKKAICGAYFSGRTTYGDASVLKDACDRDPDLVIKAEARDFLVSVNSKPTNVSYGRAEVLDIKETFIQESNSAVKKGYSLDANIGGNLEAEASAGIGCCTSLWTCIGMSSIDPTKTRIGRGAKGNLGLGIKMGVGGKAYAGKDFEIVQKGSKNASITSTEKLKAQPLAVSFQATTKKCLLISLKDEHKDSSSTANMNGRYLCAKSVQSGIRSENYFLLNHALVAENNAIADVNSSLASPMKMLVRGQRPYNFLKSILTNDKFGFKLTVGMTSDRLTEDPTNFITQEAPLMLSSSTQVLVGTTGKSLYDWFKKVDQ